jgi:transcriptional regulator GlxA family with amidase domain
MDYRIEKVVALIKADPGRRFRLDELSQIVNLSPSRLCHLFKRDTGMSIISFVRAVRIKVAEELLENSYLSIKEIRAKIGFCDESNFVRAFEKVHATSPSGYRISFRHTKNETR